MIVKFEVAHSPDLVILCYLGKYVRHQIFNFQFFFIFYFCFIVSWIQTGRNI